MSTNEPADPFKVAYREHLKFFGVPRNTGYMTNWDWRAEAKAREFWDAAQQAKAADSAAEIASLRADAERWRHTMRCVRMDNFGGYVVHPDDPVAFSGIVAKRFGREIDAALTSTESGNKPERSEGGGG